jgi:thiamine-monophosphate kinase
MKLTDIGEFGFIGRFESRFNEMIHKQDKGIGDDCAILSINETEAHVVSTDLLIEDIHFLKDRISPEELGYKSLAVNLSDIAAMGAKPLYSFLSIGIPKNTDVAYLDRFMDGYYELSGKYNCPLMGGDTTKSADRLVINVGVIGIGPKADLKLRSDARDGDIIGVSGNLGDSGGGLKVLLDNLHITSNHLSLIKKHHKPEPRIEEGLWLGKHSAVHAMMDISDGISSDLEHILKASKKMAQIDLDKIPASEELKRAAKENQWDINALTTGGGEDYELLFTVKADEFEAIQKAFSRKFGKSIIPIGRICTGETGIQWFQEGNKLKAGSSGFDHFA